MRVDREYELFKAYKQTHDKKIRDELVEHYTYMARILAHKFDRCGVEYDDVYQVACMGVVLALERFDPDRGVRFATFATPTIMGEIRRFLRDKARCVKIPRNLYELLCRAESIRKKEGHVSANELAQMLDVPEETVLEAYRVGDAAFIKSLEDVAYTDGGLAFSGMVGYDEDGFTMIENRDFMTYCMKNLSDRETELFRLRFYDGKTQRQTAKVMGVSQMYVSRMEHKIIERLKKIYQNDFEHA